MTGLRGIDGAMREERPAKQIIRSWWVEAVRERIDDAQSLGVPAYLTLPGAHAGDIRALIDAGLLELTDTGHLTDDASALLAAYESNGMAVSQLKKDFPNLDVRNMTIKSALSGAAMDAYPSAKDKKLLRALVVNLDFNSGLHVDERGSIELLDLVQKFVVIHGSGVDRARWFLCLTLNAGMVGPCPQRQDLVRFVCEAAAHNPPFAAFMARLAPWLDQSYDICSEADTGKIQRFLLALVPAKLAHAVRDGWTLTMAHAARYGQDHRDHAPMVTFVFAFDSDPAAKANPRTAEGRFYESLDQATGMIGSDGSLSDGLDPEE